MRMRCGRMARILDRSYEGLAMEEPAMSRSATDRILDDLRRVMDDAESLMRETATVSGERAQEARVRAGESLKQARERLESLEAELVKRARDAAHDTDRYVRDNPWQSIGIAGGIGLLIGVLLSRR
jgi:ElaB/YqjD/DUF883 family membrane-anchored ribosome-binding protein